MKNLSGRAAFIRALLWVFLLPGVLLPGGVCAESPARTGPGDLRVLVVKIVDQGHFLSWLLAEAVQQGQVANFHVETTHVRNVGARLRADRYDLVIAHAHAKPAQKLAAGGQLTDGRVVFANARAIVGPATDPAGVREATGFDAATARIVRTDVCWLVNQHPGLRELQERVVTGAARPACVIDAARNSGAGAITAAQAHAAYTVWGYHPFMQLHRDGMQAFAFGDRFLLRPLKIWIVADGGATVSARRLTEVLLSSGVQQRIAAFRLPQDPLNQAWWPAADVQ
jgi:ABC-type tungstate transport system permease subunit